MQYKWHLVSLLSNRADPHPSILQHGVWGWRVRPLLHPETLQRVLPQLLHHCRLRSVHHGHAARQAHVHQGKEGVLNRQNVLKWMNKWWGANTLSFYVCQQNMRSLLSLHILLIIVTSEWKEKWHSYLFPSVLTFPVISPVNCLIEQTNMAGVIIYCFNHSHYSMCLLIKVVRNPCEIFLAALDSAEKLFMNLLLGTHFVCCHIL